MTSSLSRCVCLCLLLSIFLAACGKDDAAKQGAQGARGGAPVPVAIEAVRTQDRLTFGFQFFPFGVQRGDAQSLCIRVIRSAEFSLP